MTKHTMELVWHSCDDCVPEEDYNSHLYLTDGEKIVTAEWYKGLGFVTDDRVIAPGITEGLLLQPSVTADGIWWADLLQTVNKFAPIQKSE